MPSAPPSSVAPLSALAPDLTSGTEYPAPQPALDPAAARPLIAGSSRERVEVGAAATPIQAVDGAEAIAAASSAPALLRPPSNGDDASAIVDLPVQAAGPGAPRPLLASTDAAPSSVFPQSTSSAPTLQVPGAPAPALSVPLAPQGAATAAQNVLLAQAASALATELPAGSIETSAISSAQVQANATGPQRGAAPRATAGTGFAAQLADQSANAAPVTNAAAGNSAQIAPGVPLGDAPAFAGEGAAAGDATRVDPALPVAHAPGHRAEAQADATDARSARPAAHPATTQVAVSIARAVADGVERISIKLQPPELGRIDVRLDVGADGRVQAYVLAERPATLEILQRDARDLERALNGAGLDTANGGLSFGLRQNGNGQAGGDGSAGHERRHAAENRPADGPPTPLPQPSRAAASGRLDIQV